MKKTTIYADMWEDWIAEILREAGRDCVIRFENHEYRPACMRCEDGIYTSGAGYYIDYFYGVRSGYVAREYLIAALAHKEFSITEDIEK